MDVSLNFDYTAAQKGATMRKIIMICMLSSLFAYPSHQEPEVLNKILKLDKHCPFVIGNKTFDKSDLQDFKEQEIDDLIEISSSSCCLSSGALSPYYFDKLRGMRTSIKQGMIIQRCSYDKIIDDNRVDYCTKATTCCAVVAPFVEALGWMSFGCNMSKAVLWWLACGWAGAAAAPCAVCCGYTCCEVCCGKSVCEEKSNF